MKPIALFLAVAIAAAGCTPEQKTDPAGDYWCVQGASTPDLAGRCAATEPSCTSHIRAAPAASAAHCERTHTVAHQLKWTSQYGAMEAWYVDAASCEKARQALSGPPAPCAATRWDETGKRAH